MTVIEENPTNKQLRTPRTRRGDNPLEADTQARGRTLLAAVQNQERKASATEWLYSRLMALTTADDKLKVELFRFVDALPALKTPQAVANPHLRGVSASPGHQIATGGRAGIAPFDLACPDTRATGAGIAHGCQHDGAAVYRRGERPRGDRGRRAAAAAEHDLYA